jgi:hypothetical protein
LVLLLGGFRVQEMVCVFVWIICKPGWKKARFS